MDDSILKTIKKMLGLPEDYDAFDQDLIIHINSVFANLHQIGASPPEGFYINDATAKWSDFFEGRMSVQNVKTLVYMKVRLIFDPPATSFAITALENLVKEQEWRLSLEARTFNPDLYKEVVVDDGL